MGSDDSWGRGLPSEWWNVLPSEVMFARHCECAGCHWIRHFKMAKMIRRGKGENDSFVRLWKCSKLSPWGWSHNSTNTQKHQWLLYHCYLSIYIIYVFFSTFCFKHLFLLNLLKTNSLRWNLHTVKVTCFKCTIQWILVNLLSCAAITTILELLITPRRSLLPALQSIFTMPTPSPWQPLMCFLSL